MGGSGWDNTDLAGVGHFLLQAVTGADHWFKAQVEVGIRPRSRPTSAVEPKGDAIYFGGGETEGKTFPVCGLEGGPTLGKFLDESLQAVALKILVIGVGNDADAGEVLHWMDTLSGARPWTDDNLNTGTGGIGEFEAHSRLQPDEGMTRPKEGEGVIAQVLEVIFHAQRTLTRKQLDDATEPALQLVNVRLKIDHPPISGRAIIPVHPPGHGPQFTMVQNVDPPATAMIEYTSRDGGEAFIMTPAVMVAIGIDRGAKGQGWMRPHPLTTGPAILNADDLAPILGEHGHRNLMIFETAGGRCFSFHDEFQSGPFPWVTVQFNGRFPILLATANPRLLK